MTRPRTVTLEFLRHGPPHNQLLSPLTQYLALCGNHSAATVRMPFEQQQLIVRLNALVYRDSAETRQLQLTDTGQILGGILADVPGLIAELADLRAEESPLIHLRLILSASELALLPFELANAPDGFPGAGQPIALQAQSPICITREVRRVSNTKFHWPGTPRILFAAAAPPSVGPIPLEEHLLALRRVIDPWVDDYQHEMASGSDYAKLGREIRPVVEPHLVILPQASVSTIQAACAETDFTHVHILAHGVQLPGEEKRYGLALHADDDPNGTDIVDGVRLATLLRTYRTGGVTTLSGPAVVTLASCQGGQQGSVVGAGASIAHALHEGGIPLVVAAQFPISFRASVLMAEVLYEGLLWGNDPRTLLNDLRWQLKAKLPETHDWASLVAYAALPTNIRSQLLDVRIGQAHRSINSALKFMDEVTDAMIQSSKLKDRTTRGTGDGSKKSLQNPQEEMNRARKKKDRAVERLKALECETTTQRSLIYGLLASTEKRDAKIIFFAAHQTNTGTGQSSDSGEMTVRQCLIRARDYYKKAFEADKSQNWALVQEICLHAILDGPAAIDGAAWTTARFLSEGSLYLRNRKQVIWAHSNLIELFLLGWLRPDLCTNAECRTKALYHAEQLSKVAAGTFDLYSARRQIERYSEWFQDYESIQALVPLAKEVLEVLPTD